jgi:predicted  nucleic acid-binding Zn-ribbon protein
MTTATETPDGERLARLETRAEHLELQGSEIRQDIRDLRTEVREEIRALRTEHREDFQRLEAQIQRLESQLRQELEAQRSKADKQFRWTVGIVITVGLSIIALGATAFFTILNRIGG